MIAVSVEIEGGPESMAMAAQAQTNVDHQFIAKKGIPILVN
jgi:hypothetical protein